jgi:hypothetical protein
MTVTRSAGAVTLRLAFTVPEWSQMGAAGCR